MDRNISVLESYNIIVKSLSARRAWIEIPRQVCLICRVDVALRKESVDRNSITRIKTVTGCVSLSARRAWIEI